MQQTMFSTVFFSNVDPIVRELMQQKLYETTLYNNMKVFFSHLHISIS